MAASLSAKMDVRRDKTIISIDSLLLHIVQ